MLEYVISLNALGRVSPEGSVNMNDLILSNTSFRGSSAIAKSDMYFKCARRRSTTSCFDATISRAVRPYSLVSGLAWAKMSAPCSASIQAMSMEWCEAANITGVYPRWYMSMKARSPAAGESEKVEEKEEEEEEEEEVEEEDWKSARYASEYCPFESFAV